MDNKLFVGNLPWSATEEDLNQLFSQFGTVESVEVLRDKFTNRARGFGFVTMSNGDEANAAVAGTEGQDFMGRPLKVNVARPREEGADRPRRSFDGPRTGGFGAPREGGFGGGERRSFGGPREGGFGGGQGGYAPRQGGFGGGAPRQGGFGGGAPRQGGFGGGQGGFGGGQGGGQGGYRFKPKPRRDFGGDEG